MNLSARSVVRACLRSISIQIVRTIARQRNNKTRRQYLSSSLRRNHPLRSLVSEDISLPSHLRKDLRLVKMHHTNSILESLSPTKKLMISCCATQLSFKPSRAWASNYKSVKRNGTSSSASRLMIDQILVRAPEMTLSMLSLRR